MDTEYVHVKVEEGILRGQVKTSIGISKIKYYAFQGVPFAKPPIGQLRFKAPEPPEPWDGVRDALQNGTSCCQTFFNNEPMSGDEDCLYLNVFTPELPTTSTNLKPVLFNIHGGGFANGSGSTDVYTPDYFVEHDVLFVSPNYRCGALGFLSLQNDDISGNAGLKDQVQALIWTRKNIRKFGGDPENVTIMGISAGGASVEYLLLTELTKGLFKRAIIQSGSTLNSWSFNSDPRDFALRLAERLGYTGDTEDNEDLGNFFKNCSAKDLVENQNNILNDQENMLMLKFSFAPCVEKEGQGQKFITSLPREILKNGKYLKVPIITGLVNNEGWLYYLASRTLDNDLAKLNDNFEMAIPMNLNVPENKKPEVARQIREFYFGDEPVSRSNIDSFTDIIGSLTFNVGINESTKYFLQTSQEPVYAYGVSYCPSICFIQKVTLTLQPDAVLKGVPHGGDLDFLFRVSGMGPPAEPSVTDLKYIKIVTTMFTSFAKTGNPNYEGMEFPAWEPASTSVPQYLDIGDELKMTPGWLHEERLKFWNKLYKQYGYLY